MKLQIKLHLYRKFGMLKLCTRFELIAVSVHLFVHILVGKYVCAFQKKRKELKKIK